MFVWALNWLMGTSQEYYDSRMVARGKGGAVTRVVSSDRTVKVNLMVTIKDFPTFGYVSLPPRSCFAIGLSETWYYGIVFWFISPASWIQQK
jgi:hypothetical protein